MTSSGLNDTPFESPEEEDWIGPSPAAARADARQQNGSSAGHAEGADPPRPVRPAAAPATNGNGSRAVAAAEPAAEQLDVSRLRGQLLDVEAVCALPPPEPLIGEVLVRDSVAVLYGKPGCGKSFVALDWALCVATGDGMPWQGREVRGGKVLYIAAEGLRGLGPRIQAWRQAFTPSSWPPQVVFYPRPLNLLEPRDAAALVALAGEDRYALVVIDTLNRSLVGGDENSSRDMGMAVDTAVNVQQASGATVLFLHHTGRNDEIRGHSSLDGGVDTMIKATGDADGNITLRSDKQKDAEAFAPIDLHRDIITLGDGSTSCVIRAPRADDDTTAGQLNATEQRLLTVLQECFPGTGARTREWMAAAEMSESAFHRARGALVRKGAVQASEDRYPLYSPSDDTPEPA